MKKYLTRTNLCLDDCSLLHSISDIPTIDGDILNCIFIDFRNNYYSGMNFEGK